MIFANTLSELQKYFNLKLQDIYNAKEIHQLFKIFSKEYLNIEPYQITINPNYRISESEYLKFRNAVKQLLEHKPYQYIIGHTYFLDLKINVNQNVLIPRPETEMLVDLIIKECKNKNIRSIIDICTGSACIGIALKKHFPNANVYAIDISEQALNIAKQNAELNQTNIVFIKDDVLNLNTEFKEGFDIIVSNPPYVTQDDKRYMQRNVIDYEPPIALFVEDNNPIVFYQEILKFYKRYGKPDSKLYLEINENKSEELLQLFQYQNVNILNDLNDKQRYLFVSKI